MAWDFSTDAEFEEQLTWMRAFMREEVWPLELLVDELPEATYMAAVRRLQEQVKERGLWAAHLPRQLGGQGMGQVKLALMHEIAGTSIWLGPLVFGTQAPDSGNAEILALYGSPEQKSRWLEPILAGDIRSAFSMTEPFNAGSDPVQMSTTARLEDDEWVVDGHKWFTSNALVADLLIVMAVTDPDAQPYRRASMLLVPAEAPGVDRVRNIPTLAGEEPFGHGHSEVIYRDVRVPASNLLGERGRAFEIAQARLGPGRIHHCMRWLGQSRRAFDILCERAQQREIRGAPLGDRQIVQAWVADSVAEMQAARLMTLHAAWKIDTAGVAAARREISMIKYFGARVLHDVVDRAIQVCGSLGYSEDLPLAAMYRFARAARIYDGPDEVHRQTVARLTLRDYATPDGPFPSEHIPTNRRRALERYAATAG